ncbi:MAG: phosphatase PAP2 family protein [Gemmataceae bacterium]
MLTPLSNHDRRLIATGIGTGAVGFALVACAFAMTAAVPEFDAIVSKRMNAFGWESPRLTEAMQIVTWFGSLWCLVGLTVLGTAAALGSRDWRLAVVWVVTMSGQGLTVDQLKLAFERPRAVYERPLAFESTFSFPSGHSAGSLCGYGLLGHVLGSRRRVPIRFAIAGVSALVIAAVGFSRIYLAVHYVSDVLAGYCVGAAWLSAGLWWYERAAARTVSS